jgi:hypothetical protein
MNEIKNASEATEKASAFILEKNSIRGKIAEPIKAVRENDTWLVEFNIGIVRFIKAYVKINSTTGEILEYHIPPCPEDKMKG